jgi:translation initiation factor eIF-2B subunit epsilon
MGKKEKAVAGEKKGGGGGGEDAKRDQKLQAILLADSFSKSFRPITWEKPKVLLPLVNVPMIEYTIEFLALNGVEEVPNVIISSHTHQMHIGFFKSNDNSPHLL